MIFTMPHWSIMLRTQMMAPRRIISDPIGPAGMLCTLSFNMMDRMAHGKLKFLVMSSRTVKTVAPQLDTILADRCPLHWPREPQIPTNLRLEPSTRIFHQAQALEDLGRY